jgi:hypothetical protein
MQTKKIRKTIVHSILLALMFFTGITTTAAQQKYQIAGKVTQALIDIQESKLDDVLGRTLFLSKIEGVNFSTGKTEFMDGARVIAIVTSDNERFSSTFQGYSRFTKKGDVVYFKVEGNITNTQSDEGNPITAIEASFSAIKGTGQYENIRCTGTYKGKYISGYIMTLEWESEYWIEK